MNSQNIKACIMDQAAVDRAITRIAHEIIEKNKGVADLAIVGIQRRGVIKKSTNPKQDLPIFGTSQGIRTPVTAVRGRCPRPLDQGGIWLRNKDSNLNNTSQSRRCYRYTIPHRFNAVYYNKALFICQAKILFPRCRFSPKN